MKSETQRAWVASVKRVVIKIGSRVLVDERHQLDEDQIARLVDQMARLRAAGKEVICVSSGAIAAGLNDLGLSARPVSLPAQQSAAAIGQARLIGLYRQLFAVHGLAIGQVLLSHADLHSRQRHLNARNTMSHLLSCKAVPIVNENDTVAVEEIRFGDNDVLSALVSMLVRADALIVLSSIDGLMAGPDRSSHLLPRVTEITDEIRALAGGSGTGVGVGGMRTKIEAADMMTRAGGWCVVANGRTEEVLPRILAGETLGTVFEPGERKMAGRKQWIAFFDHPQGSLQIDAGAVRALREQGRSLLAIGITAVMGSFQPGSPVRIVSADGLEIGRGLVNFSADELERIKGRRSDQIAQLLERVDFEEVIHRDNLVLRAGR